MAKKITTSVGKKDAKSAEPVQELGLDATIDELDLAIGGGGNRLAVGDEKDGGFLFASEASDELDDGVTGGGVEIAGGFVGEKNRRLVDEGAGDGGALKLPSGELVGAVVGAIGELDGGEEVAGAGPSEGIDPT
jgi:hypothetical protein